MMVPYFNVAGYPTPACPDAEADVQGPEAQGADSWFLVPRQKLVAYGCGL